MKELEKRILRDGEVRPGNVLKVGSFLNHQLDIRLLDHIGAEFHRLFGSENITKVLTIEASGIAIAAMTARHFDVPVLFAKKAKSLNLDDSVYTASVHSFTYDRDYNVTVSRQFLTPDDRVIIVDDFMANGKAMAGLLDICRQAGAEVAGIGICIEKGFQGGGDKLRKQGYRIESLALIDKMDENGITFR